MEDVFDFPTGFVVLSRFKILKPMSVGDQSQAYAVQDTITGILYTLKFTRSVTELFALELVGSHPNVVSIFRKGSWSDNPCRYLVLDACQGDLQSQIIQSHKDSAHFLNADRCIISIFVQILDAVEYCHVQGVYHRDLKPANILIWDDGLVRLANFGLAARTPRCKDFGVGTEAYMAPECWPPQQKKTYHAGPSDIWSLGIILINLMCHKYPWTRASTTDDGYVQYRQSGHSLSVAMNFSPQLDQILGSIFQHDPKDRVSISKLRRMIVACSGFRRREPSQQTIPLDLTSEKVLVGDATTVADQRSETVQTHEYNNDGGTQQKATTDWYYVQIPEYSNCVDEHDMALCRPDLCQRCVEETHVLCNAPQVWTRFAEDVDHAVDHFGWQAIYGATM